MPHPLNLPEIADHIGSFLTKNDLCTTLHVSRHWHQSFLPVIWREFSFGVEYGRVLEENPDIITRHAPLIQALNMTHIDKVWAFGLFSKDFPRLNTIELQFDDDEIYWSLFCPLQDLVLRLGPRLQSFKIRIRSVAHMEKYITGVDFLKVLQGCNHHSDTELETDNPQEGQEHAIANEQLTQRTFMSNLSVLSLNGVQIDIENLKDGPRSLLAGLTFLTLNGVHFRSNRSSRDGSTSEHFESQEIVPYPSPSGQISKWRLVDSLFSGDCPAQPRKGENRVKIEHLDIRSATHKDDDDAMKDAGDQYQLILECQNVKDLTWVQSARAYNQLSFAQDLARGSRTIKSSAQSHSHFDQNDNNNINNNDYYESDNDGQLWPYLESLRVQQSAITDSCLSEILLAIGDRPFKELNIEQSLFHSLSLQAMADTRWQTLERLFLHGCRNVTGAMVIQCLAEFPNLREFSGPVLTAEQLRRDPRPWVCLGLEKLNLPLAVLTIRNYWVEPDGSTIMTPVYDIEGIPLLLDRISTLTRLEELSLLNRYQPTYSSDGLLNVYPSIGRERICLGRWMALKRLRIVRWRGSPISREDAQWMLDNWPSLEEIEAWTAPPSDCEVGRFLKQHGLRCTMISKVLPGTK